MADPVAQSAISGASQRGTDVHLSDLSGLHKWLLVATVDPVGFGLNVRGADGTLRLGYGYDEELWLAEDRPAGTESAVDLTHGLSALRLGGALAAELLSRVCALDLSDGVTPDRTLRRVPVAGLAVVLVRDDVAGERSYLLLVDRSHGQSLYDVLCDAGHEFALTPEA